MLAHEIVFMTRIDYPCTTCAGFNWNDCSVNILLHRRQSSARFDEAIRLAKVLEAHLLKCFSLRSSQICFSTRKMQNKRKFKWVLHHKLSLIGLTTSACGTFNRKQSKLISFELMMEKLQPNTLGYDKFSYMLSGVKIIWVKRERKHKLLIEAFKVADRESGRIENNETLDTW